MSCENVFSVSENQMVYSLYRFSRWSLQQTYYNLTELITLRYTLGFGFISVSKYGKSLKNKELLNYII